MADSDDDSPDETSRHSKVQHDERKQHSSIEWPKPPTDFTVNVVRCRAMGAGNLCDEDRHALATLAAIHLPLKRLGKNAYTVGVPNGQILGNQGVIVQMPAITPSSQI